MVYFDLKLVPAVPLLWNRDYLGCASPSTGHILQQAYSDRVKTSCGNLVANENVAIRNRAPATGHAPYQGRRRGRELLICGKRRTAAAAVLQDARNCRIKK